MQICFHIDGGDDLYLRVPTVWDDRRKQWIGFVKTPKTKHLIHGEGKDSFELQNSFNSAMANALEKEGEIADEVFSLFKPLSHWKEDE